MARDYTVIYTHPRGATATFIYQEGELSALAKGLDAEQFWVFKQVKSLLLRNEEGDLGLASQMMAQHGFTAKVIRPLPDLMAQPDDEIANDTSYRFRRFPAPVDDFAIYRESPLVSEIHWREGGAPATPPPPHRAPALTMPAQPENPKGPVKQWQPTQTAATVSELHWREPDGHHAKA